MSFSKLLFNEFLYIYLKVFSCIYFSYKLPDIDFLSVLVMSDDPEVSLARRCSTAKPSTKLSLDTDSLRDYMMSEYSYVSLAQKCSNITHTLTIIIGSSSYMVLLWFVMFFSSITSIYLEFFFSCYITFVLGTGGSFIYSLGDFIMSEHSDLLLAQRCSTAKPST